MSQSSSSTPLSDLPASALSGDPGDYLRAIDASFRPVVCTMMLLYLHRLRGVYHDNGPMLVALAQIEAPVAHTLASLQSIAPVTSRFVAPPLP